MKALANRGLLPWHISENDFPYDTSPAEKWRFLLGYAVLAPSTRNSQPWLFRVRGERLDLYADRSRSCHVVDPDDREMIMSCGCGLFHLRLAMTYFGQFGKIEHLPAKNDPNLLARATLGLQREKSSDDSLLFQAITKRHTNRQDFSSDEIPAGLMDMLGDSAAEESAWLESVAGQEQRHVLASLIAEGNRRQWSDKQFRSELASWVRPNDSVARDGIPASAQASDDLLSSSGPQAVLNSDLGQGQAAKDQQMAETAPLLAILGTPSDSPLDWLHAGQALARVLLQARAENVWCSFLNQAIEFPDLRNQLRLSLGLKGFPQVCLRMGLADNIKPTPRREVCDVLI